MSGRAWALVGAILGTSVLVHAIAVTWAIGAQVDLVRDDYYEAGETFDAELDARSRGVQVGFKAVFSGDPQLVTAADEGAVNGALKAVFYRPNDRQQDTSIGLTRGVDGWHGVAALDEGHWRLRLVSDGDPRVVWLSELRLSHARESATTKTASQ